MGKKVDRICQSLRTGLSDGLASHQLYLFVTKTCPSASAKQIKRAWMMVMMDLDVPDKPAMEVIYGIALSRGLRPTA